MSNNLSRLALVASAFIVLEIGLIYGGLSVAYYDSTYSWADQHSKSNQSHLLLALFAAIAAFWAGYMIGKYRRRGQGE